MSMSILVLFPALLLASIIVTGFTKHIAARTKLVDLPVARSAHSIPVPTAGGISIVLLLLVVVIIGFERGIIPTQESLAILGAVAIAAIGVADDLFHLDIKWRMPVQLIAAVWSVFWLGGSPPVAIGSWSLDLPWLLSIAAVLSLIWLLNLYNFMDGIDGIAASQACFVSLATILIVIKSDDLVVTLLSATLLAASAGFLVWNWAPAKIFMGDVGSGFLGFSFGVIALISIHHGSMYVWTWLLLLGVFIVDSTVTLMRRFVAGEKWYEGHSAHAYQIAARRFNSHPRVTITILVINACWLGPMAWLTVVWPEYGSFLTIVGLSPLVILACKLGAGKNYGNQPVT